MAIDTQRPDSCPHFVRIPTVLGGGSCSIDVDAIVIREELRGKNTRWGIEFYEPPLHVVKRIKTYVWHRLDEMSRHLAAKESLPEPTATRTRAVREPHGAPSVSCEELERLYDEALSSILRRAEVVSDPWLCGPSFR
jgi:hypothetical protein